MKSKYTLLITLSLIGGGASVCKSLGIGLDTLHSIEKALGNSIYLHAIVAISLGAAGQLSSERRIINKAFVNPIIIPIILMVILDESLQLYSSSRHFSWLDMSANVAGVLFGALSAQLLITTHKLIGYTNSPK